ncbi:MAG: hypothetical protein JJ848_000170 [Prochlorococcus marinus CUG1439]|uniref:hypothetical protein n=1 Tax=Prochlorococcus sp. MIT 1314 TaxID=3096220 RepID=UPI001B1C1878|nr:hypothetical protein [Prochlorococcus sp. MIT 1314]MCR8538757.1 hypothetical protein [Prochlorococcus marinus CUG1439]
MNQENKFKTPILIIAWKRPKQTKELIQKIKQINPANLYIACDGPTNQNDIEENKVKKTKELLLRSFEEVKQKKYLFSKNNQGCKLGVSNAINWFFENEKEGIILEDDCIPHLDFFSFCQEMLETYRNDERIWSITGHNQQHNTHRGNGTYYFSKYPRSWGWATWRRAWEKYDRDITDWPNIKSKGILKSQLKNQREIKFWEKTLDNIYYYNSPNTWDYQWTLCSFLNSGLTIVPNKNLIKNIGFDEDATHTFMSDINTSLEINKANKQIIFPTIHPNYFVTNIEADEIVDILEYSGGDKLSKIFIIKKFKNLKIKLLKFIKVFIYRK